MIMGGGGGAVFFPTNGQLGLPTNEQLGSKESKRGAVTITLEAWSVSSVRR